MARQRVRIKGSTLYVIGVVLMFLGSGCDKDGTQGVVEPVKSANTAKSGLPSAVVAATSKPLSHDEAVALLKELGSPISVSADPSHVPWNVILRGKPITDDDLRRLAAISSINSLDISDTKVTDAGLAHLTSLKELRGLSLCGDNITDLRPLASLPALIELDVKGTKIRESDLQVFATPGRRKLFVHPFPDYAVAAWTVTGKLKATEWSQSKDGTLSLRLLTPDKVVPPPTRSCCWRNCEIILMSRCTCSGRSPIIRRLAIV